MIYEYVPGHGKKKGKAGPEGGDMDPMFVVTSFQPDFEYIHGNNCYFVLEMK